MFHYRELNYNIIKVSERCLYVCNLPWNEFFIWRITEKNILLSIHYRNIQALATETFIFYKGILKYEAGLPTESVTELRQLPDFSTSQDESVHYGRESLVYLEPEIWEIIHKIRGLRESTDTNLFIYFAWVVQSSAVTVLFS